MPPGRICCRYIESGQFASQLALARRQPRVRYLADRRHVTRVCRQLRAAKAASVGRRRGSSGGAVRVNERGVSRGRAVHVTKGADADMARGERR